MDIWVTPLIVVTLIICLISFLAIRKSSKVKSVLEGESRDEINVAIEEHPFTLNPILWVIVIAASFIGIVIIYSATSFY